MDWYTGACLVLLICLIALFAYWDLWRRQRTGDANADDQLWQKFYCQRVRVFGFIAVLAAAACAYLHYSKPAQGFVDGAFGGIFGGDGELNEDLFAE